LKEDNAFDSNESGMRISSMSKNDMMNFRSRFLKNNAKGGENESQGANSGQALSSYIKNSCGKFSGINGSSHNNSGNNSSNNNSSGNRSHHSGFIGSNNGEV